MRSITKKIAIVLIIILFTQSISPLYAYEEESTSSEEEDPNFWTSVRFDSMYETAAMRKARAQLESIARKGYTAVYHTTEDGKRYSYGVTYEEKGLDKIKTDIEALGNIYTEAIINIAVPVPKGLTKKQKKIVADYYVTAVTPENFKFSEVRQVRVKLRETDTKQYIEIYQEALQGIEGTDLKSNLVRTILRESIDALKEFNPKSFMYKLRRLFHVNKAFFDNAIVGSIFAVGMTSLSLYYSFHSRQTTPMEVYNELIAGNNRVLAIIVNSISAGTVFTLSYRLRRAWTEFKANSFMLNRKLATIFKTPKWLNAMTGNGVSNLGLAVIMKGSFAWGGYYKGTFWEAAFDVAMSASIGFFIDSMADNYFRILRERRLATQSFSLYYVQLYYVMGTICSLMIGNDTVSTKALFLYAGIIAFANAVPLLKVGFNKIHNRLTNNTTTRHLSGNPEMVEVDLMPPMEKEESDEVEYKLNISGAAACARQRFITSKILANALAH